MNKQQETSSQNRDFKRPSASQRKRGVGQTRGFFNRNRQQEESNKLEEVRKSVEQSKIDSENVKNEQQADPNMSKKRDNINKKIELGKEFVSKFFKAFVKPERGNIKVTIDETIDDRIAEPYIDRIDSYLQLQPVKNFDEMLKDYILKFKAITNIGIAIKLFHSATSTDQLINNHLTSLRLSEVPLPKKMNLILNQLGKTDLLNDNHIRLHEHHLLMKKFMCKSLIYWYDEDLTQYLENETTIDVFKLALFHHWDHMIDKTIKSVDVLKLKGKQFFLEKVNRSYKFKIGDKIYDLKLPDFNFDRDIKISDINNYFKNDIFVDFAFKTEDLNILLGTLTFQVAKYNWFNKLDYSMKDLEPKFANTIVADLTFRTLLSYSKIWFLDDIIKPDIMDDLSTTMISKWTNSISLNFKNFLELENFRFSAFGTDAQLIEIDEFKEKDNLLHSIKAIKNRSKIRSVLKTTEQGAVIGLSVGFSKKVEFSSKFEVSYDGKNNTILKEILKSDFK